LAGQAVKEFRTHANRSTQMVRQQQGRARLQGTFCHSLSIEPNSCWCRSLTRHSQSFSYGSMDTRPAYKCTAQYEGTLNLPQT
jgi:hypothetical protein